MREYISLFEEPDAVALAIKNRSAFLSSGLIDTKRLKYQSINDGRYDRDIRGIPVSTSLYDSIKRIRDAEVNLRRGEHGSFSIQCFRDHECAALYAIHGVACVNNYNKLVMRMPS